MTMSLKEVFEGTPLDIFSANLRPRLETNP